MKTSNYILIAFFSFIIGSILVLFIAAIGHENDPYGGAPGYEQKECPLEDFSVIVVESNLRVHFNSSENNSLSFYLPKGQEVSEKPFRISNDTLFIYPILGFELHHTLQLSGNRLSTVIAKNNSRVSIRHFNSETLSVDIQQANFSLDDSDVRKLNIQGDKAEVWIHSTKIDLLSARLKNESSLNVHGNVNKIDIEKDETSRYSLYQ